jgi:hypothetical protein
LNVFAQLPDLQPRLSVLPSCSPIDGTLMHVCQSSFAQDSDPAMHLFLLMVEYCEQYSREESKCWEDP